MFVKFFLCGISLVLVSIHAGAQVNSNRYGCTGPDTSAHYEGCMLSHSTEDLIRISDEMMARTAPYLKSDREREGLRAVREGWTQQTQVACQLTQEVMGGLESISLLRCENFMATQFLEYLQQSLGIPVSP